jgi:DNA-directed RNA polymerase specialized sigma24 family protein
MLRFLPTDVLEYLATPKDASITALSIDLETALDSLDEPLQTAVRLVMLRAHTRKEAMEATGVGGETLNTGINAVREILRDWR